MSIGSNIKIYIGIYNGYQDYQSRVKNNHFWRVVVNPLDVATKFACSRAVEWIILPAFKVSYSASVSTVATLVGLLSQRHKKFIKDIAYDPVSTKSLLWVGRLVESWTKPVARCSAFEFPILSITSKCGIAFFRHIYVVSKDFTNILSIPDGLRGVINWENNSTRELYEVVSQSDQENCSSFSDFGKRSWISIKKGIDLVSQAILATIAKILILISLPFKYIPYFNVALDFLIQKVQLWGNYTHKRLLHEAHRIIDAQETKIRSQIVGKVISISVKSTLNYAANSFVKYRIWEYLDGLAKLSINSIAKDENISEVSMYYVNGAVKVLSLGLFGMTVLPSLAFLHQDYEDVFNSEASTLKELSQLIRLRNLPQVVTWIYKKYHK